MEDIKEILKAAFLKKKLKGDVYIEENSRTEIQANDGKIEKLSTACSFGAGVRVFKNGKMGFSYFTVKGRAEAEKMLDTACGAALTGGYEGYEMAGQAEAKAIKLADKDFFGISLDEKKEAALRLERSAGSGPKVRFVRDTTYTDQYSKVYFYNTAGAEAGYEKSFFYFYTSAVAVDGNAQEAVDAGEGGVNFNDVDIESLGMDCSGRAAGLLNGGSIRSGKYKLILPPYVAADFVSLLARMFLGNNINKGKSLLASCKPGDRVGSDILAIRDDALLDFRAGSYPVDGEGTAGSNKAVVENGKLKTFLYDIISAKKIKKMSTGNSSRQDFKTLPECGASNYYIEAGAGKAGKTSGILVNSLMGLHTADTVSGNFSLGINGWMVEKGEKKQAIKETLITGNIKDMLLQISDVCDDLKFYGNFGSPTIVVEGVQAAGK
jgi:PmbA protein